MKLKSILFKKRLFPFCLYLILFVWISVVGSSQKCQAETPVIKNVIYMIGDGMGMQQLGMLNSYVKYAPHSIYIDKDRISSLEKAMRIGTLGFSSTEAYHVLVTDSAASGTQIASGCQAGSEMIGGDFEGNPVKTILEFARDAGKATGLVSDTHITHATPASFAAHQPYRYWENSIADDLLHSGTDVMLSGGLAYWIPQEANTRESQTYSEISTMISNTFPIKSNRNDSRNLLPEASAAGYQLVFNRSQLNRHNKGKILGLFRSEDLPGGIKENSDLNNPNRTYPTLKEMTAKALEILSQNPNGFFLMVEAGQIDWACHANDAGSLLHEMIRMDRTVDYLLHWLENRQDTLLIITADHSTGGCGFSYSRHNLPVSKNLPGSLFKDLPFKPAYNYGSLDILDKIYNQKRSFEDIIDNFDKLPDDHRTPESLQTLVNIDTDFSLTREEAMAVLAREPNDYRVMTNHNLKGKTYPKVNDFKEFYVYGEKVRQALLGRQLAKYQMVVWASGTHMSTPVPLIAIGPAEMTGQFSGLWHTTQWTQIVMKHFLSQAH